MNEKYSYIGNILRFFTMQQKKPDTSAKKNNSPAHIKKFIVGYAIIPKTQFDNISPGDHIRYIGIDGDFRTGGYVWFHKTSDEGLDYWMIGQSKNAPSDISRVKHFILYWNKVKTLWKKISPESDLLRLSLEKKHEYIKDIILFLLEKHGDEFKEFMRDRERIRNSNQKK
jgi:hypothetical protein